MTYSNYQKAHRFIDCLDTPDNDGITLWECLEGTVDRDEMMTWEGSTYSPIIRKRHYA